jgi:hypothetical protein
LASVKEASEIALLTAARIPDSVAQRDILGTARDTLNSLSHLVKAAQHTRGVLAKVDGEDAEHVVTDSRVEGAQAHREVVQSVGKLVAVVQASSSEASHGEREIEMIRQQLLTLLEDFPGQPGVTVDDVVKACKEVCFLCFKKEKKTNFN